MIESTPPVSLRHYFFIRRNIHNLLFRDATLTLRGRDAICLAVRHFGLKKQDTVLLPGYLCKSIVESFADNSSPEYYDIGKDFSISTDNIDSIFRSRKVKVLYVIHYFGFLHRNLHELRQLCRRYGVLLWEDHAHSALSHISYDYADAMIFSFRKILPIPDGGGLWLANSSPMKIARTSSLSSNIISMLILANRSRSGISKLLKGIVRPASVSDNKTGSIYKGTKEIIPRSVSFMSRRIIQHADIESIFNIRRDIFRKWQELFSGSRFKPVFSSLPDEVCPYGFPVWIQNVQELLLKFWQSNICLRMLWPLDEQIQAKCPNAFDISQSVFTLPIYPGLLETDMHRIVAILKSYGVPLNINMN